MNTTNDRQASRLRLLSPLKLTLLVINSICFGACLVLLAFGSTRGQVVFLTIATGLLLGAGLAEAILAARHHSNGRHSR